MNAIFAKFTVQLNSPMIEVAEVNRANNQVKTDYKYLYPELDNANDFQDINQTLYDAGFVAVKDTFDKNNVADVRDASIHASADFKQIFEQSLNL